MTTVETAPEIKRGFFTVGGTLPANAPSYVERKADTDLFSHLMEGRFCYVLTSRQVGKSSLMVRTAIRLRDSARRVAVLDLTKIGMNLSAEQWYDGLLVQLGREFGLEDEVDDFWTSSDAAVRRMGPMQRWMTALREVILPSVPGNLVIFVDEIDAVRGLPFATDEFFAGIRQVYNDRTADPELNRLTFCLIGVATPADLIRNVSTTPFNIGNRVVLTDFTEQEAEPLLHGLGREPVLGFELLRRILWWTNGHPYLTQRLCAAVAANPRVSRPAHVDDVCDELFLSTRARESDDNLLFVRERILRKRSDAELSGLLDLYGRIRAGKNVPCDDNNPLVDVLRLAGLAAIRENRLVVRNRIYNAVFDERWIRVNMPDAELRRQRIAFRKGLLRSAAIGVVILGIIGGLSLKTLADRQTVAIERYCANMIQIQQAFDSGDYASGTALLRQSQPSIRPRPYWLERYMAGVPSLSHWLPWIREHAYLYAILNHFDQKVDERFEWDYLRARAYGDSAFAYVGHRDEVRTLAVSPVLVDGRTLLATAGADSTVRIFDVTGLNRTSTAPPPILAALAVLDSQGRTQGPLPSCFLIPATGDPSWSINDQLDRELNRRHISAQNLPGVMSVRFSPDGKWLAIGTGNWRSPLTPGTVYLWSTQDFSRIVHVPVRHVKAIDLVLFRNNAEFASTSEDNTAEFWSLTPAGAVAQEGEFDASHETTKGMNAAAFSPDGNTFAMIFGDGHFWSAALSASAPLRIRAAPHPFIADVSGLMSIAFYSQQLILLGTRDGRVVKVDFQHAAPVLSTFVDTGQGLVTSVTVSRDRNYMLTTGSTGTVLVWPLLIDPHDHSLIGPVNNIMLRGQRDVAYASAMTDDGSLIVSGGADDIVGSASGRIFFWVRQASPEGVTWASQPSFIQADGAVQALAFSPQRQNCAAASSPGLRVSRGIAAIRGVSITAGEAAPTQVLFSQLDPCTGKPLATRTDIEKGHSAAGTSLAWSPALTDTGRPDTSYVATSSSDGTVLVWDAATHRSAPLETPIDDQGKSIPVTALSFSSSGWLAAIANVAAGRHFTWQGRQYGQGQILFWDPAHSSAIRQILQPRPAPGYRSATGFTLQTLAFSADGRRLAVCGADRTVQIWNSASLGSASPVLLRRLDGTEFPHRHDPPGGLQGQCMAAAFSPDGEWLAAGTVYHEVAVWSTTNWKRVEGEYNEGTISGSGPSAGSGHYLDAPPMASAAINSIAFSPDSRRLAYGTADSKIQLWNVMAQLPLPVISVHTGGVLALAFSPDGHCIASGSNDQTVRFTCEIDPNALTRIRAMANAGSDRRGPETNNWIPFAQ